VRIWRRERAGIHAPIQRASFVILFFYRDPFLLRSSISVGIGRHLITKIKPVRDTKKVGTQKQRDERLSVDLRTHNDYGQARSI